MAKPWAKLEIGYLNHPKFLALNANAICLWHEGKNYCDTHHTDGLIPGEALKTFRFRGVKSVELLLSACPTPKPDGTHYAPLWEAHMVGYKMHDYLDHNDCRDEVLERLGDAEMRNTVRKLKNRERQAAFRKRTTAMLATVAPPKPKGRDSVDYAAIIARDGYFCHLCGGHVSKSDIEFDHVIPLSRGGLHSAENIKVAHSFCNQSKGDRDVSHSAVTPVTQGPTETVSVSVTESESVPQVSKEQKPEGGAPTAPRPRPMAPIHDASHKKHAVCGRICLHASQFGAFVRRRNTPNAEQEVRKWAERIIDTWTVGARANDEPGDEFDFWRNQYDLEWPATLPAKPVGRWDSWQPTPVRK